ncbi:hypothetical protein RB25_20845 [Herbaspirillum rubrisubalbicans]|uniref:DUF1937 domain-containing protein n=1 Tax=Herbaspirillum rubrisubalbicans TaxID=80842 RepID=A0ABX9BYS2_9BURK|nr:DUF1937 family protein [Herbaspirillum rubrisubalbicans]RAM63166.1 hypothetical protein RB24_17755 [Herbaspirillum rubrisubalbicans]RAN44300.1 hypothetical protein RB25_20845 [Herbaspirillum rubrisubalbicans]
MRKIFLACPYGHSDKVVVEHRFQVSNAVAANIVSAGATVFSQVSMSHPINAHLVGLDKAAVGQLWAPVDAVFMEAMEELIVIDEPGWKESSGVAREIQFFKERGRRVSIWSEVKAEFSA